MISHPERSCNIEVDFLAKILFSLVSSRALDDCRSPLLQTDSFSPLPLYNLDLSIQRGHATRHRMAAIVETKLGTYLKQNLVFK